MIKVVDIMTQRVVTVDMDDRLTVAKEIFDQAPFNHLIVTENDELRGVLSERDLLKAISPNIEANPTAKDLDSLQKRVHQVMSRDPISVAPSLDIVHAAKQLLQHEVGCLPVLENNTLVGILTWKDLLKAFIQQ